MDSKLENIKRLLQIDYKNYNDLTNLLDYLGNYFNETPNYLLTDLLTILFEKNISQPIKSFIFVFVNNKYFNNIYSLIKISNKNLNLLKKNLFNLLTSHIESNYEKDIIENNEKYNSILISRFIISFLKLSKDLKEKRILMKEFYKFLKILFKKNVFNFYLCIYYILDELIENFKSDKFISTVYFYLENFFQISNEEIFYKSANLYLKIILIEEWYVNETKFNHLFQIFIQNFYKFIKIENIDFLSKIYGILLELSESRFNLFENYVSNFINISLEISKFSFYNTLLREKIVEFIFNLSKDNIFYFKNYQNDFSKIFSIYYINLVKSMNQEKDIIKIQFNYYLENLIMYCIKEISNIYGIIIIRIIMINIISKYFYNIELQIIHSNILFLFLLELDKDLDEETSKILIPYIQNIIFQFKETNNLKIKYIFWKIIKKYIHLFDMNFKKELLNILYIFFLEKSNIKIIIKTLICLKKFLKIIPINYLIINKKDIFCEIITVLQNFKDFNVKNQSLLCLKKFVEVFNCYLSINLKQMLLNDLLSIINDNYKTYEYTKANICYLISFLLKSSNENLIMNFEQLELFLNNNFYAINNFKKIYLSKTILNFLSMLDNNKKHEFLDILFNNFNNIILNNYEEFSYQYEQYFDFLNIINEIINEILNYEDLDLTDINNNIYSIINNINKTFKNEDLLLLNLKVIKNLCQKLINFWNLDLKIHIIRRIFKVLKYKINSNKIIIKFCKLLNEIILIFKEFLINDNDEYIILNLLITKVNNENDKIINEDGSYIFNIKKYNFGFNIINHYSILKKYIKKNVIYSYSKIIKNLILTGNFKNNEIIIENFYNNFKNTYNKKTFILFILNLIYFNLKIRSNLLNENFLEKYLEILEFYISNPFLKIKIVCLKSIYFIINLQKENIDFNKFYYIINSGMKPSIFIEEKTMGFEVLNEFVSLNFKILYEIYIEKNINDDLSNELLLKWIINMPYIFIKKINDNYIEFLKNFIEIYFNNNGYLNSEIIDFKSKFKKIVKKILYIFNMNNNNQIMKDLFKELIEYIFKYDTFLELKFNQKKKNIIV